MGIGLTYVPKYALQRVRERWPSAATIPQVQLLSRIAAAIDAANADNEVIVAPGGSYIPFSYNGEEGFLVLKKKSVVTAMRTEWCPEVTSILEKKRKNG